MARCFAAPSVLTILGQHAAPKPPSSDETRLRYGVVVNVGMILWEADS